MNLTVEQLRSKVSITKLTPIQNEVDRQLSGLTAEDRLLKEKSFKYREIMKKVTKLKKRQQGIEKALTTRIVKLSRA